MQAFKLSLSWWLRERKPNKVRWIGFEWITCFSLHEGFEGNLVNWKHLGLHKRIRALPFHLLFFSLFLPPISLRLFPFLSTCSNVFLLSRFLSPSSPLLFSIYFSKCLFLSLSFPSPFLSTYLSKSLSLSSVKAVLNSVSSSGIATRKAMRGKPKTRLVRDAKLLVSGSCMSQVWRLNKCNFVASHLWWTQSMITFYIN